MLHRTHFERLLVLTVLLALVFYGCAQTAVVRAGGTVVADSGFRPEVNGLPFENYGPGATNLTPAEMQRIFGDQVCGSKQGDNCILTPPAEQWMTQVNAAMNGGHCYGFSVLSLRMFQNPADVSQFGADNMLGLKIQDNVKLQRELA